ncbi:hypothetical protein [Deefgea piscis]|uniref:hypothetical protein n=1 Tax=Deefgea piscis TaxID=2739061 RepID=UPI001C7F6885|nr:hypothetical protein [Deefgea piscis]QZA82262.1 hypothetical protein K4H25_06365 [Deefgea piscis]
MNWIDSISRSADGFVLNKINKDGRKYQESMSNLSNGFFEGKTKRTRINTHFQDWQPVTGINTWNVLGLIDFHPADQHQVYECTIDEQIFLIPAQVLIKALIRPIKHLNSYVFQPAGLDQISLPLLEEDRPSSGFFIPLQRLFGSLRGISPGILAAFCWMHCFPSARAMWHSIYQFACVGRLDLKLPAASVTSILHYVEYENSCIVTDMTVMSLTATEPPFEFASAHPASIVLHESLASNWKKFSASDTSVPSRNGIWKLSDAEWEIVRGICEKRNYSKHSQRKIIDLILTKRGTGISWRKLDFNDGLSFPIVIRTSRRMEEDGRWHELLQELRLLRSAP